MTQVTGCIFYALKHKVSTFPLKVLSTFPPTTHQFNFPLCPVMQRWIIPVWLHIKLTPGVENAFTPFQSFLCFKKRRGDPFVAEMIFSSCAFLSQNCKAASMLLFTFSQTWKKKPPLIPVTPCPVWVCEQEQQKAVPLIVWLQPPWRCYRCSRWSSCQHNIPTQLSAQSHLFHHISKGQRVGGSFL